ncbi:MAG: hypothetical protein RLZZ450_2455 [Pseudomonadota bacterium]
MNALFRLRDVVPCLLLVACTGPGDDAPSPPMANPVKNVAAPDGELTDNDTGDNDPLGAASGPERDEPVDATRASDDLPAPPSAVPIDDPQPAPERIPSADSEPPPERIKSDPTKWQRAGLPPAPAPKAFDIPPDQPQFAALLAGGAEGSAYANCVSKAPGQSTISSDVALPVGNGRYLECTTIGAPATSVEVVMSDDDTPHCVTATAVAYQGAGDRRLQVSVTSTPQRGSWTFTATSDQAFELYPVQTQDGAVLWPVWIYVDYQYVGLDPYVAGAVPFCPGAR